MAFVTNIRYESPLTQGGEGEGGGEEVGGAASQQGESCASRSLQVKFLLLQETQYKAEN